MLGILVIVVLLFALLRLARDAAPAGAQRAHARRGGGAGSACGPRRGVRGSGGTGCGRLAPVPPSSRTSSEGSGSCLTAHQTSQIAATIGSLSMTKR